MENYLLVALGLSFLGQLMVWIYDIQQRDIKSRKSPEKFSIVFYLKDNYIQLPASISLSLVITTALYYTNLDDLLVSFMADEYAKGALFVVHLGVGIAPSSFFTWIKRTSTNGLKPKKVTTKDGEFIRK